MIDKYPTMVKAVWTEAGITFGFHMHEPTPALLEWGIKGRDDSMAWWDDNVELLFDLTGKNEGSFTTSLSTRTTRSPTRKDATIRRIFPRCKRASLWGRISGAWKHSSPYAAFPETVKPSSGSNTDWHGNFARHRVAEQGKEWKVGSQQNPLREYQRMNTTYASHSDNLDVTSCSR